MALQSQHELNPIIGSQTAAIASVTLASQSRSTSSGSTYTVREGDVDETIARRLGVSVRALRDANQGVNWYRLRPGQKLQVPRAGNGSTNRHARSGQSNAQSSASARMQTVSSQPQIVRNRVTIGKSDVIVREAPSTDSGRVAMVDQGRTALILERKNGWFKLRFDGGTVGWVRGDLLQQVSRPSQSPRSNSPQADLTAQNSRPRPSTSKVANPRTGTTRVADPSELPATPDSGEKVVSQPPLERPTQSSQPGETVAVIPQASRSGAQAAERAVTVARRPASTPERKAPEAEKATPRRTTPSNTTVVSNLLDTARDQMGIRYVWGGTSRSGFDCSGFTQWVFARSGIRIPRTSIEQATVGQRVDRDDLRPGDLVFFRTRGSRISHVGIYIGNNNFIHASSGGGRVRINAITGYYSQRYVTARRMPGLGGQVVETAKRAQIEEEMDDQLKKQAAKIDDASRGTTTTTTTVVGN